MYLKTPQGHSISKEQNVKAVLQTLTGEYPVSNYCFEATPGDALMKTTTLLTNYLYIVQPTLSFLLVVHTVEKKISSDAHKREAEE